MNAFIINELIKVLDQEIRVYDDILKISKNKTNIIIEGKVSELEDIIKLEQSLVLHMGRLENMRETMIDKLSKQLNLKPSEVTISILLEHLDEGLSSKLKSRQDSMINILGELKSSNDLNSKLIKNSLDYIDFSVNLMAEAEATSNNYGDTGQVRDSSKRNFFDLKL